MDRLLQSPFFRFSYFFCCIFLGFIFLGAGLSKLYFEHRFIGLIGPVWLIEALEKHQLGFYGSFIAYCQVIIGFLLITLRFRVLGAVMLVPMLFNILMITISLDWRGTPYVIFVFLLMNLFLLVVDYKKLLVLICDRWYTPTKIQTQTLTGILLWISGLCLCVFSVSASFYNLPLAYTIFGLGITISFLSIWVDKRIANDVLTNQSLKTKNDRL